MVAHSLEVLFVKREQLMDQAMKHQYPHRRGEWQLIELLLGTNFPSHCIAQLDEIETDEMVVSA